MVELEPPTCVPDPAEITAVKVGFRSKCINCRTYCVTRDSQWLHERNSELLCHPEAGK